MTGKIIASCGHEVEDAFDMVSVRYGSESCDAIDGFQPCVVYAEYCQPCASEVETRPECIRSEAEEDEWLNKGPNYQRWAARA